MGLTVYVFSSFFVTSVFGLPYEVKEFPQVVRECRTGEVLENDCNKCICSDRKLFECTPKKCNSIEIETSCRPDTIYVKGSKTCICNRFGKWPHQDCSNIFQNLPDTEHCKPNTYITVDCNVCRCGSDGKIDEDHCTKNPCQELKKETRRKLGTSQVYGACDVNSWYSLAPCQFCYCVNKNKLVCNTGNNNPKKLELGSYRLNVCGKDLLKDVYDLLPQNAKKLRDGNILEETTETVTVLTSSTTAETDNAVLVKDISNHLAVSTPIEINYDITDSESKSSESDENVSPQIRIKEFTAKPSTMIIESSESTETNTEGNTRIISSNETPVELVNVKKKPNVIAVNTILKSDAMQTLKKFSAPAKIHKKHKSAAQLKATDEAKYKDVKFNLPGNLDLPKVLDKVFQTALRNSMVSIVEDSNCKPGSTTAVKCNVCFCTNDSKMMCTNSEC